MYIALGAVILVLVVVGVFLVTALFGAPYVASGEKEIIRAFDKLRPLTKDDVLVDFGCGDGVVLRAAAKSGAKKAVGIEINPILVTLARRKSRGDKKVQVINGDMTKTVLPSDMTVVYVFGLDRVMKMIMPVIEKHVRKHGKSIDVVSKAFEFNGMKPIAKTNSHYLYRIDGALQN
ncbi:MAG: methyltransferase domain-containing protein [Candidatus Saccharimonadales bacterium]